MPTTKKEQTQWHKGSPPHIGWWQASTDRISTLWRWWDGRHWSASVTGNFKANEAARRANYPESPYSQYQMEWNHYWPKNARVPRIDPARKLPTTSNGNVWVLVNGNPTMIGPAEEFSAKKPKR
jgi:hypothetical protein